MEIISRRVHKVRQLQVQWPVGGKVGQQLSEEAVEEACEDGDHANC